MLFIILILETSQFQKYDLLNCGGSSMEFTIKEAQPIQPESWQIGFFILIFQLWYFRVTILNSDGEKFMQSFPDTVFNVTHFADVGPLWIQGASLS